MNVYMIRRHLSCFAVRLGNTKHFMVETHIGSSCVFPQLFSHCLCCVLSIRKSVQVTDGPTVATFQANNIEPNRSACLAPLAECY